MAKKVILTIDDEEHILDLLEYNLEKNGYEVLRAETGEKGLAILKTMQVDLVLLDYMLPGMDGIEVLKSLRAKVCAYLLSEAERAGSLTFSIPFSRIQLADYLNCDRSALSRELSQMQRDGLLDTYKSSFKLLEPETLKQMVQ